MDTKKGCSFVKRNIDIEAISDGEKYTSDSMVRIACNDCQGCDKCCHDMGESIVLDPFDIWQMSRATGRSPEELLANELELAFVDGLILPHIKMAGDNDPHCAFLINARCSIHDSRPGFCRLFPLARVYKEDGGFDYIHQIYECDHPSKSKIKIKKWLGIPNIKQYEKFVVDWHGLIATATDLSAQLDENGIKNLSMQILNNFYLKRYSDNNFFEEFYIRFNSILNK